MFDKDGELRKIKGLNFWPLWKVLHEKYKWKESEAKAFADFLLPMLEWDPENRAKAKELLSHQWLTYTPQEETKLSEQEIEALQRRLEQERDLKEQGFDDDEIKVETSRLVPSDYELNQGDDEMYSLNDSVNKAASFLSSDDDWSCEEQSPKKKGKKRK